MKFASALFSVIFLVGCASIQSASPSMDRQAKAFNPNPTKAILYIYRDNVVNAAVAMDVLVNGRYLGKMRSGHFMKVDLNPGLYTVTSRASNDRTITLNAQAGKLYFIQQEGTFKLFQHGTDLHQVGSGEGKKAVVGCTLVEHLDLNE